MTRIGIIGLGRMGHLIARNLLVKGHEVVIAVHHNRSPVEDLVSQGATACGSFAQVAAKVDVLIFVLPDAPEVEEVLNLIVGELHPGQIILDMSTIALDSNRAIASRVRERGTTYIDAPISGGPKGAIDGTLSVMVGCSEEDFSLVEPFLRNIGRSIFHCGEQGMGLVAKLANNLIVASELAAIGEAMDLARRAGMPMDRLFSVLQESTSTSRILAAKAPMHIAGEYPPGFSLALMHKDLEAIARTARVLGGTAPLGAAAKAIFSSALLSYGHLDCAAVSLSYQEDRLDSGR